jgi:dTDP-4-amino-4,6-dideoxy-D-glucose acyltransferase
MNNPASDPSGSDISPEAFRHAGGFRHKDTVIYEPSVLVNLGKFQIERGVRIDAFCYLLGGTGIHLGARTHVAAGVSVGGGGKLITGWCCSLSAGVNVVTGSDSAHQGLGGACVPAQFRSVMRGEVIIEDFAMVFTRAVILPDVKVGRGAIIGACSLVRCDIEPWAIYAGVPARRIGARDQRSAEKAAEMMLAEYGY